MGIMMLAWLVALVLVVLVVARVASRGLPSASPSSEEARLLAQQAERIEQLEEELRRVQEQADFTERLLTERSTQDKDSPKSDSSG